VNKGKKAIPDNDSVSARHSSISPEYPVIPQLAALIHTHPFCIILYDLSQKLHRGHEVLRTLLNAIDEELQRRERAQLVWQGYQDELKHLLNRNTSGNGYRLPGGLLLTQRSLSYYQQPDLPPFPLDQICRSHTSLEAFQAWYDDNTVSDPHPAAYGSANTSPNDEDPHSFTNSDDLCFGGSTPAPAPPPPSNGFTAILERAKNTSQLSTENESFAASGPSSTENDSPQAAAGMGEVSTEKDIPVEQDAKKGKASSE